MNLTSLFLDSLGYCLFHTSILLVSITVWWFVHRGFNRRGFNHCGFNFSSLVFLQVPLFHSYQASVFWLSLCLILQGSIKVWIRGIFQKTKISWEKFFQKVFHPNNLSAFLIHHNVQFHWLLFHIAGDSTYLFHITLQFCLVLPSVGFDMHSRVPC